MNYVQRIPRAITLFLLLSVLLTLVPDAAAGTIRSTHYGLRTSYHYSSTNYSLPGSMTVEAWVYRESSADAEEFVLAGADRETFIFGFYRDVLTFRRGDGSWVNSVRAVPTRQWTHVAASYDDETRTVRFYIDGELAGTDAIDYENLDQASGVTIANTTRIPVNSFVGYLDEIRLWSVARTQQEIADHLEVEVRRVPGLKAAWGEGGPEENLRNTRPSHISDTPPTLSGFGILPRKLIIPKAAAAGSMLVNGTVDPVEYAGAEQMVLRYADGENGVRDAVAYFKRTNDLLFVGIRGARAPHPDGLTGGNRFEVYFNTTGASEWPLSTNQKMGRFDLDGDSGSSYHKGAGFVWGAPEPRNTWNFHGRHVDTPTYPNSVGDIEFSINVTELGGWNQVDRIGLGHLGNGSPDHRDAFAPDTSTPLTTGNWAEAVYVGTDGELPTLDLKVTEYRNFGASFQIVLSDDRGETIAERTTDESGVAFFDKVLFDPSRPVIVSIVLPEYARGIIPARTGWRDGLEPTDLQPTSVTFPPCVDSEHWYLGTCDFKDVSFRVHLPPGPQVFGAGDAPLTSWPSIATRSSRDSRWTEPGVVEASVSHRHDLIDYYLVKRECPTPLTTVCVEGVDFFFLGETRYPSREAFEMPQMAPSQYGTYQLVAHDRWRRPASNPDLPESWVRGPEVELGEPPFELVHSFHFSNRAGGGSWEEMTSVYGDNIFADPDSCQVWPHYATWLPVYQELASRDGSCVGMSAMSRMIADGRYDIRSWDPDALFARGHSTNGIDPVSMLHLPPTPDRWNKGAGCGFTPSNLWAQICRSHGMQFSAEMVASSLPQLMPSGGGVSSWEGDPLEVLARVEADPSGFVICMTDGFESGHCVTALGVVRGYLDASGPGEPEPQFIEDEHSLIIVHDGNAPGEVRYIEIEDFRGDYRYPYPGVSHSGSGLSAHPISIWEADQVSMPDPRVSENLHLIVYGQGSDVLHRDLAGNEWGWKVNTFLRFDSIPGVKALASFSGPDGDSRNPHVFIPASTELTHSHINVREDGDYGYYAAESGRQVQVTIPGANADETDRILLKRTIIRNSAQIDGVQIEPGAPRSDASITLCDLPDENTSVAYRLDGLALDGDGKYIASFLRPAGRRRGRDLPPGIRFENGGAATTFDLSVHIAETATSTYGEVTFPDLTIPAGATGDLTLPHWPAFDRASFQLDLDADGRIDQTSSLDQGIPVVEIANSGADIAISYPQAFSGWQVQSSEDLRDSWRMARPRSKQVANGEVTVLLARDEIREFVRLALP